MTVMEFSDSLGEKVSQTAKDYPPQKLVVMAFLGFFTLLGIVLGFLWKIPVGAFIAFLYGLQKSGAYSPKAKNSFLS